MKNFILATISILILVVSLSVNLQAETETLIAPAGAHNVTYYLHSGDFNNDRQTRAGWCAWHGDENKQRCTDIAKNECALYDFAVINYSVQYSNPSNPFDCYNDLYNVLSNNYPETLAPWYGFQCILEDYPTLGISTSAPLLQVKIIDFVNVP